MIHNLKEINFEDTLNKLTDDKLKIDFAKFLVVGELFNLSCMPIELFEIVFKLCHFRPILSKGTRNVIHNTYSTHIFCDDNKIANYLRNEKRIPSSTKQLFIEPGFIIFLDSDSNAKLWDRHSHIERIICKNIKRIHNCVDKLTFYFEPANLDRIIYQLDMYDTDYFHQNDYYEIVDDTPYKMMVCSRENVFYVLTDGTLHAEGSNAYGQLGFGHKNPVDDIVKVYCNLFVEQVCTQNKFTIIRTAAGKVYGCGEIFGRLAYPTFTELVDFESEEKIIDIDCSDSIIAVLTVGGRVTCEFDNGGVYELDGIIQMMCCGNNLICMFSDESVKILV